MSNAVEWMNNNANLVNALTSVAMTVVWIVYLQIALTTFRRQRRPRLIISQARRLGTQSTFMLINLSQEPVHISCILVAINVGDEEQIYEITDFEHSAVETDSSDSTEREETMRYGPVQAGSFLILGPTSAFLSSGPGTRQDDAAQNKSLEDRFREYSGEIMDFEIRVVGVFSTDNRTVGACRKYRIINNDDNKLPRLQPATNETKQLVSIREQEVLNEWSEVCRCA